jgi:GT2 family glycosyltransferase
MRSRSPEPLDVEWVEGSFLMVSRRCVETVGPLDPYLFFYWEETDFCRRARYQGWRVVLVPRALARHYAGGWSDGNRQNTITRNWLQTRNYYVYHLANPSQGFMRNIVDTVRLLCVKTKTHLREEPVSTYFELRVFFNLVKQVRTVHKKWRRDRNRRHPRMVTRDLQSVATDIVYMPGAREAISALQTPE